MKKILSLAILLMAFIGFTACSNDDEPTFSLTGKNFQCEPVERSEMIDKDGDFLVMTVARNIQFIDEKTAILVGYIDYEYPEHPEWNSHDMCYGYMECNFEGNLGTLTITKFTMIMTGYYDYQETIYEEEPYTVWKVRKDEKGHGLYLLKDDSERLMEEVAPIKDLKWQEFPPMTGSGIDQTFPKEMPDFKEICLP